MFERTDFSSGHQHTDLASEMESPAKGIRTPMLIRKAAKGGAYNSVRLLELCGNGRKASFHKYARQGSNLQPAD